MNAMHYQTLADKFPLKSMPPIGGRQVQAVSRLAGPGDGAGLGLIYHVLTETLAGQVIYITDDKSKLHHIQYQASVMIGCNVMGIPGNILFIYARSPDHAERQLESLSKDIVVFLDPELGKNSRPSNRDLAARKVMHIDAELI